jgi:hypothetical protein
LCPYRQGGVKKRQTKAGKNRGAVWANPIVQPAYRRVADQVGRIFEEELEYELDKVER